MFARYATEVRDEWIDYNGHLHDAAYAIVLSEANEVLLDELGLSETYRERTGCAMYTVASHIRYLAECRRGDRIEAASFLVSADAKRLRVHTGLTNTGLTSTGLTSTGLTSTGLARAGATLAATGEYLYLHVNDAAGRVTAMPPERWAAVQAMLDVHAGVERPDYLGRGIGSGGQR